MHYYMTRKGGSMVFRLDTPEGRVKKHIVAGQSIPADCLEFLGQAKVDGHVKSGTFVAIADDAVPSDSDLGAADVNPIPIGTGDKDFMPEAQALPGKQKDQALLNLLAEQERIKTETTIDEEMGGTPDGAVKVERPVDEDDDDEDDYLDDEYEDMMTDAEREAIAKIERGEVKNIFDKAEE